MLWYDRTWFEVCFGCGIDATRIWQHVCLNIVHMFVTQHWSTDKKCRSSTCRPFYRTLICGNCGALDITMNATWSGIWRRLLPRLFRKKTTLQLLLGVVVIACWVVELVYWYACHTVWVSWDYNWSSWEPIERQPLADDAVVVLVILLIDASSISGISRITCVCLRGWPRTGYITCLKQSIWRCVTQFDKLPGGSIVI